MLFILEMMEQKWYNVKKYRNVNDIVDCFCKIQSILLKKDEAYMKAPKMIDNRQMGTVADELKSSMKKGIS